MVGDMVSWVAAKDRLESHVVVVVVIGTFLVRDTALLMPANAIITATLAPISFQTQQQSIYVMMMISLGERGANSSASLHYDWL